MRRIAPRLPSCSPSDIGDDTIRAIEAVGWTINTWMVTGVMGKAQLGSKEIKIAGKVPNN